MVNGERISAMRLACCTALLIVIIVPGIAVAVTDTPKEYRWWEVVGGILAIPVGVVSLAYSYVLIRKTRLEARKTELEIHEKERALGELAGVRPEAAREIMAPIIAGRQGQYLVLRFVLLYVVLQLWGLVKSAFGLAIGGAFFGAQQFAKLDVSDNKWLLVPLFLISSIPQVVDWLIVLGLGLPLFRDLNRFLGVDLKAILLPWRRRSE